eukprot:gb/GFBE01039852.1/.p1 GENE.gb/GFBE01039852.1/~~gb/GFBE01039852.1/.p1  ORF type:complete len:303 (+),score=53.70 gb/GFBE01039852.1/:1-909(+)
MLQKQQGNPARRGSNAQTPKETAAINFLAKGSGQVQGGRRLKPHELPGHRTKPVYIDEDGVPLRPTKGEPPRTWPPEEKSIDDYSHLVDCALWQELLCAAEEEAMDCARQAQAELDFPQMPREPREEESDSCDELDDPAAPFQSRFDDASRSSMSRPASRAATPKSMHSPKFPQLDNLTRGLCLAYERQKRWVDLDQFVAAVLPYFGATRDVTQIPKFAKPAAEDLWVFVNIKRGLACAFIGGDHYVRAQGYLQVALRVQPRNRTLARVLENLRFLESQLPVMGEVQAEDLNLAQALAAIKS